MLGRLYSIIFMCAIFFAFWYQRAYLNRSAIEFNAQLNARNAVLPVSSAEDFNTLSYQNGLLKSSFSGRKIVYFSNGRFEAQGNLIYREYNSEGTLIVQIKTDLGEGEMQSEEDDSSLFAGGNKKLKYIALPNQVFFTLNGNQGKTQNVYMNGLQRIIQSDSHLIADGEMGHIEGNGFIYRIDDGEFKIKSHVSGKVNINDKKNQPPTSKPNKPPAQKEGFEHEL